MMESINLGGVDNKRAKEGEQPVHAIFKVGVVCFLMAWSLGFYLF